MPARALDDGANANATQYLRTYAHTAHAHIIKITIAIVRHTLVHDGDGDGNDDDRTICVDLCLCLWR